MNRETNTLEQCDGGKKKSHKFHKYLVAPIDGSIEFAVI